jgi:zinc ribbon protein
MKCRQCGTEIADKAIVCYRCGTPTTEAVRKAVPVKPRRSPLIPGLTAAVLVAVAIYLWRMSSMTANAEFAELAAGLALGAAAVVLILLLRGR